MSSYHLTIPNALAWILRLQKGGEKSILYMRIYVQTEGEYALKT